MHEGKQEISLVNKIQKFYSVYPVPQIIKRFNTVLLPSLQRHDIESMFCYAGKEIGNV